MSKMETAKPFETQNYLVSSIKASSQIKDEARKSNRCYLRYNMTIKRAMDLNKQIYGKKRTKDDTQFRYEHSIRVAGYTQLIKCQTIKDYHMCWLVAILHDLKQDSKNKQYHKKIDEVLQDLLPQEIERVKKYVDQLTSDETISKAQKKKLQMDKIDDMELLPCWVRILDKYDNCRRFVNNQAGKSQEQLIGYYAIAYIIYEKAINRFKQIKQNIPDIVDNFYKVQLFAKFFKKDINMVKECATKYCNNFND